MKSKGSQLIGKVVNGYKIIKAIGEGKFSQVYRAENQNKVPFAMKNIKIFDKTDQKSRDKFLKEVELMKPLDHPNIIKYIDSFIDNNELFIITEWAEKGDLKKLIKEHAADDNPFDQPTIWEYVRQIASALKHMHEKKIMHRDLKPANIFISSDMSLKIGDLGLGRVFGSQTLEAYSKVGTPLYMSPQLIKDEGYNFNADVWSLGCICYELCELNSPFRNKQEKMSLLELFENITKCNYKPISNRFSAELSQIIKKMIVVDPNYRFSSEQALEIAEKNLKGIKKPLLDPFIVMDDIYIKLSLLDYERNFCPAAERKHINRFYFAFEDPSSKENDQLFYFLELCYWIMALSKPEKKREKLAIISKTNIDWSSPQSACTKLFEDLTVIGVRLEQMDVQSLTNGYGESICYILNEVLNRELIRINFQFQEPNQAPLTYNNKEIGDKDQEQQRQLEDQIERSEGSESIQEESQFEQSIFFKKGNRKLGIEDMKLLEKIHQYGGEEEQKEMILGKVDENQWKLECLRVDKKMTEITAHAKETRKKGGYQNFETIKINSSKITDLIRSVRPMMTKIANNVEADLDKIKSGEQIATLSFESVAQKYSSKNEELQNMNNLSTALSNSIKQSTQQLEKTQEKLGQVMYKINISSSQTESNKVSEIKKSIKDLKEELKNLEVKEKVLSWQVRNEQLRQRHEGKPKIDHHSNFDFDQN